nr:hypothetical protein [Pandoravirus massiliensis]
MAVMAWRVIGCRQVAESFFKKKSTDVFNCHHRHTRTLSLPSRKAHAIHMAQPKTETQSTERTERRWFNAVDDADLWKQFAEKQYDQDEDGIRAVMFCAANRHIDPSRPGPIAGLVSSVCRGNPNAFLDDAIRRASKACKNPYGRNLNENEIITGHVGCIRKAANFLGHRVSRPIIPADYAETVAAKCDIKLQPGIAADAFVAETNRARLCVLGIRMARDTPLRGAIRLSCKDHGADQRFSAVYDAARRNGASMSQAAAAANSISE